MKGPISQASGNCTGRLGRCRRRIQSAVLCDPLPKSAQAQVRTVVV